MLAPSACSRRSGLVSTSTFVIPPSPDILCASNEQRSRRFFGLAGSQAPQSPPIRGTPGDEPHPSTRNRRKSLNATSAVRHFGKKAEEVFRCLSRDLFGTDAAHLRQHGGDVPDIGGLVSLTPMRRRGEERRVRL